ncbi:MAG: hypothetical protein Q4F28_04575 [Eubacteriales bacterium]|nr:hypothetical protein [Eubacteriales bacterium]
MNEYDLKHNKLKMLLCGLVMLVPITIISFFYRYMRAAAEHSLLIVLIYLVIFGLHVLMTYALNEGMVTPGSAPVLFQIGMFALGIHTFWMVFLVMIDASNRLIWYSVFLFLLLELIVQIAAYLISK